MLEFLRSYSPTPATPTVSTHLRQATQIISNKNYRICGPVVQQALKHIVQDILYVVLFEEGVRVEGRVGGRGDRIGLGFAPAHIPLMGMEVIPVQV